MRTEERKVRYYQFYEVGEMTRAKVLDADTRIYLGDRERTLGMMKDKMIYIATAAGIAFWFWAADCGLTMMGY